MNHIVVIDPGHGGKYSIGHSSPNGVCFKRGPLEKEINLALSKGIASGLPPRIRPILTRYGDYNLSLRDRAATAYFQDADVFISLHANAAPSSDTRTWIHSSASPGSYDLANLLARTLQSYRGSRTVHRAPLSVLHPQQLPPHSAACLVEVSCLNDCVLYGDKQFDRIARDLARAVSQYLRDTENGCTSSYGIPFQLFQHGVQTAETAPHGKPPREGPVALQSTPPPGESIDLVLKSKRGQPKSCGIYVPNNFRKESSVDIILYLHGYVSRGWNSYSHNRFWTDKCWLLREAIEASGKNVILVFPTLTRKSSIGNLYKNGNFDAFMQQVLEAITRSRTYAEAHASVTCRSLIIACHSGGGSPMLKLALSKERSMRCLRELWGFDCVYGKQHLGWIRWASAFRGSTTAPRLYLYYQGSTTRKTRVIGAKGFKNVSVTRSNASHDYVPIKHWRDRLIGSTFLKSK